MCIDTRSDLNLNKLLNFWPSQKLKYFFVTFINVSEPSVQYIPSTNSTLKGISTQKPEAKSQVSEIMAKQIIKGNVRETSTFFFNIIYDSNWDCGFSKQMDSFSSFNSVIWNHNSKHCLFQHNLKRRFQLHNYQHRVSLLHGAREHIKFQTWSSHSVHCGVLTAQLKFEVRCSKWRRRYTPCKSNDVDIQKWTTNKACICSFYCHIVKKNTYF